ncbi:MAG: transcription antitermination factor NusB [Elusimicrobiota bacterium]
MGTRRDARKLAVRVLYAVDVLEVGEAKAWDMIDTENGSGKMIEFARNLVAGTLKNIEFIDKTILKYTENWEMERIASVDKAIIRMGLYEIFFDESIPRNATINEAVELAKYFSTEKSHKFVNGILDSSSNELKKKK